MNARVNLQDYAFLFSPERVSDVEDSKLPYFYNCRFDSESWVLRSTRNSETEYTLPLAKEPVAEDGELLGDNPDLLKTVKLHLIHVCSSQKKSMGIQLSTPEAVYRHYIKIIGFIRFLKFKFRINNLSSINKDVAGVIIESYLYQTSTQRLDLEARALNSIESIFADPERLETFKVKRGRRSEASCFDHAMFCRSLGVTNKSLQSVASYQTKRIELLEKHGFQYKKNIGKNTGKGNTKVSQGETVIRKNLTSIKSLFQSIHTMPDLYPKTQRVGEAWLSGVNLVRIAKKASTSKRSKTRNIPRPVFYKLMDEAIRWVIDYSDDLIGYRQTATDEYERFLYRDSYSNQGNGTQTNQRHYASKQMSIWFKSNQPKKFPYPIASVERQVRNYRIDPSDVTRAKILRNQGLTLQEIADNMGVSRSTVHRWLWWERPIDDGTSLDKAINKHLVSACLLVVFAFTGRRKDEIMGLEFGSIVENNGSYFIVIDQQKFNQGERPLPTIKLVSKAIEVLETIGVRSKSQSGRTKLLRLKNSVTNKTHNAWPDFNDFCDYTGIKAVDDDGHDYSFADHQFRRFLAMTYWYRYPSPDLPALSWFFGHSSTEVTMDYITDDNGLWAMQSVKNERIIDLIEEELGSVESVVGGEIEELIGSIEIQGERRAELMEKKGKLVGHYQLNFVPDGACFGSTKEISLRSKCQVNGVAQLSAANWESCKGCPNLLPIAKPLSEESAKDLSASASPILNAIVGCQET